MSYAPPSYRNFKRFVGELTAYIAGAEAILQKFAEEADSDDELSQVAGAQGIVLSGVTPASVVQCHSRLAIVSIASGLDQYFTETEEECKRMGLGWEKRDKTSKMSNLIANANEFSNQSFHQPAKLNAIEYYIALRNWVAHPGEKGKSRVEELFTKNGQSLSEINELYRFRSAPNAVSGINFHDSKLFAKLLLDVLKDLSSMLRPTDSQLVSNIPRDFLLRDSDTKRQRKRAAKHLESKYGLQLHTALEIINDHYDALA